MTFGKCIWDGCTRHAIKASTAACRTHHALIRQARCGSCQGRLASRQELETRRCHRCAVNSRRLSSRGTGVAPIAGVDGSSDPTNDGPQQEIIYRFSVNRGMAVALVIETPDWYSGLLQSALARVRIEGQN